LPLGRRHDNDSLDSGEIAEAKAVLRRQMRERREALSVSEGMQRAAAATVRLLALPELAEIRGQTVAGYVAVRGEIDPAAALIEIARRGATVVLPRASAADRQLRFHAVRPGGVLLPGAFGIPEPEVTGAELAAATVDLLIVPGLAFDSDGRRVGSGGGFYDAAFTDVPPGERPTLVGLGYDFQIVDRCPAIERDVPVDVVVSDARVLRRPPGGRRGRG
jgi:5-formyltetrahydrofolate cyclo-ligase